MTEAMTTRTDTAHLHWGTRWATPEGRADWTDADPGVLGVAGQARAAGAETVLDLCSGVGRHALALAAAGWTVTALDGAPEGLAVLAEEADRRGLAIDRHQGLMTDLPFADASFDHVLSFNVIYHGDPGIVAAAIAEITRVLKPGGLYQGTMLSKRNRNYGVGTEVAPDTFVQDGDGDKNHPHFFCDAAGLVALFPAFELLELRDQVHRKPGSWHWHMVAERRR